MNLPIPHHATSAPDHRTLLVDDGPPTVYAVYGTLMSGGKLAPDIADLGKHGERVTIVGADMFDCGWFPGIVPGTGTVQAQLWRPYPGMEADAVRRMDGIEGCWGETGMYVRRQMTLAGGGAATVYVWNQRTSGLARVPSGDWRDTKSWK